MEKIDGSKQQLEIKYAAAIRVGLTFGELPEERISWTRHTATHNTLDCIDPVLATQLLPACSSDSFRF